MRNKFPLLLGAVVLAGLTVNTLTSGPSEGLHDQIWVSHMPKDDKDTIQVLVVFSDPDDSSSSLGVGIEVFQSQWKTSQEIFFWDQKAKGAITLEFPQSDETKTSTFKVWECNEKGFDLCLDIFGKRLFSMEDWVVESRQDISKIAEVTGQKGLLPSR